MKIAFFTEGRWFGKVPVNHPNMRTDLAWIHLLDAVHYPIRSDLNDIRIKYDIGIIIVPKGISDINIESFKLVCRKVGIMQEGPADYWTDYTLYDQLNYLKILEEVDFILCHNDIDRMYYAGLTGLTKPVEEMPPVLVESNINIIRKSKKDRTGSIIGGNMCHWYNGMVSFIVAKRYSDIVYAPSMGRKIPGEDRIDGLKHLPYMNWGEWMGALNNFQIGVHLMPTVAAGTFSLNCAYLGIPCVGNELVDTQSALFPTTSVRIYDILDATKTVTRLKEDEIFYEDVANTALERYNNWHRSDKWLLEIKETLENIL